MKTESEDAVFRGARLPSLLYLDTSALLKLYIPEADSEELNRALQGRRDLIVSDLAVTEAVSALARRRREGRVSDESVHRLHRLVLVHLRSGVFLRSEMNQEAHRDAEGILLRVREVPLRAADALHLALAAAAGAKSVITFDRRLAEGARRVGLSAFL
ncbi:MAG: type II toxin-antitoxin system VapC family toxin [Gammaproteobacteria bacterium]